MFCRIFNEKRKVALENGFNSCCLGVLGTLHEIKLKDNITILHNYYPSRPPIFYYILIFSFHYPDLCSQNYTLHLRTTRTDFPQKAAISMKICSNFIENSSENVEDSQPHAKKIKSCCVRLALTEGPSAVLNFCPQGRNQGGRVSHQKGAKFYGYRAIRREKSSNKIRWKNFVCQTIILNILDNNYGQIE